MAPKRASSSSAPATPTKKKAKSGSAGQASISSFFGSPSSKGKEKEVEEEQQEECHPDELFALQLAAQDAGVSLAEMRKRMARGKKHENGAMPVHPLFAKPVKAPSPPSSAAAPSKRSPSPTRPDGPSTPRKPPPGPAVFDLAALDTSISTIDFTQDILVFDPLTVTTQHWPRAPGSNDATTPYALLSHAFITVSATKSRLIIGTVLTNLMRTIRVHDPTSLLPSIYLMTNHIAPSYDDVTLGIGGSITNKATKSVTGKSAATLKHLWDQTGDPGDVAYEAKKDVRPMVAPTPLTVGKVFKSLHDIAALTHSGTGSTSAKLGIVTKLIVASRGEETRWLVRTFHSHLRTGAVKKTLSSALARCFSLCDSDEDEAAVEAPTFSTQSSAAAAYLVTRSERSGGILANPTKPKERQDPRRLAIMAKFARSERLVREVLSRHPNFTSVIEALTTSPGGGLAHLSQLVPLRIGVPITPMLGSITRSLNDVYTKLGVGNPNTARAFVSEFKYDGQRVQIHAHRVPEAAVDEQGKLDEQARAVRASYGKGKWLGERGDIFVRLFSRHLEDMTSKYPDILDLIPLLLDRGHAEPVQSFMIDAEVVAIGPGGEAELLPFQTLSNRSRKDVDLKEVKVKVGVFAFDLMYLDGKSLLKSSLRVRRNLLHTRLPALLPENPLIARWLHVKSLESNEPEDVERFFAEARANRCEGIMVKTLDHHWRREAKKEDGEDGKGGGEDHEGEDAKLQTLGDVVSDDLVMAEDDEDAVAPGKDSGGADPIDLFQQHPGVTGRGKALLSTYEPDKRCESWLKVKQDYVDGLGDSLDLVPIGAWHGMGRKAQWWSPVLLAVYDAETGGYQAVCKCISGFTDAEYKSMKFERFVESEQVGASCYNARRNQCRQEYDTGGYLPDVWFEPVEVWELRFADVTLSPVYPAARGLISEERGLSTRFPRFIRRRDDKGPEEASTPQQLASMYLGQRSVAGGAGEGGKKEANEAIKEEEWAEEGEGG